MITHLPHLEEISHPRQRQILGWLMVGAIEGRLPPVTLTLKWDGSPAIVLGDDGKGFFVALKGGAKRWRTKAEARAHPLVGRKLEAVFQACHAHRWRGVYQADFLFYGPTNGPFVTQPNTILYRLILEGHPSLGLALHTQYDGDIPQPAGWSDTIPGVWFAPTTIATVTPWTEVEREEAARLRAKAILGRPMAMQHLKRLLLKAYVPQLREVEVIGGTHEGIVIWGKEPIKLVDRLGFSAENAKRWGR